MVLYTPLLVNSCLPVTALEALLNDAIWDSADTILIALEEKEDFQEELINSYQEQVADWSAQIDDLERQLSEAVGDHAPVLKEKDKLREYRSRVAQVIELLDKGEIIKLKQNSPMSPEIVEEMGRLADEIKRKGRR